MLKIFNTLTHQKEEFKPIDSGKVRMYVCGVTLYDLCHIGHGRTFIIFDVVARYLRYIGYSLKYVRNITDIDDKIIQHAAKKGKSCHQLIKIMIKEMYTDFDLLLIDRPDQEPQATQHINEIIEIIQKLIKRNHAYVAKNGDIMFSIKSYKKYGILSRQNLKKLQSGARVKVNNTKNNSIDFVLWKMSKLGEPSWKSPWGQGRPGWHIECSAINFKQFGTHFDIHGGGSDLMFPHHENEIAQSSCAHGNPYVNYWMHTGMVMVNQEKMSKSLHNFLTIRDVINQYDAETIRYFLMSSHYRNQLNYNEKSIHQSRSSLERLYLALRGTNTSIQSIKEDKFEIRFRSAMNDDFNIPVACSILFEIAYKINCLKNKNSIEADNLGATMRKLAKVLGLLQQQPEKFLQNIMIINQPTIEKIKILIHQRNNARKIKDWKLADTTRSQLNEMNIVLEDTNEGTTWRHKNY
ncbi:Cysteine--tRNA ligase [Candidatus Ecksteinia adelgidicola]|nr:Cysteine--tRNA ligase [Candidatus Ecksteinia adelgidicola]